MAFDQFDKRADKNPRSEQNETQVTKALDDFEKAIRETQLLYDQFFTGTVRQEPFREKQSLEKDLMKFNSTPLSTTAQKFRFQALRSRFQTIKANWERTTKQIEEGTYRRDKFKLKQLEHEQRDQFNNTSQIENNLKDTGARKKPNAFDALYNKLTKKAPGSQKVPTKDKFIQKIQQQLEAQKKKHPGKKVNLRLEEDKKGHIQVKMTIQKS